MMIGEAFCSWSGDLSSELVGEEGVAGGVDLAKEGRKYYSNKRKSTRKEKLNCRRRMVPFCGLECSPDIWCFIGHRRRSSDWCKRPQLLGKVGIGSVMYSKASWMLGAKLR